ncbi:MAG: response regulator transcription factor [Acidobacteriota bacterium]|nr:response regulator transcription factor [Acidobacteriota bacterium]
MLRCILIVDDHRHIREVLRAFLESQAGFEVCGEAVDGYDAIEKALLLKPDLILLDMSMPRMDGIETARKLKTLLPRTPIVLFTSHSGALRGFDTRAAGIAAVIAKDGDMSLLLHSIQGLLQAA